MQDPVLIGLKIGIILFISSFIPATAFTFFRFRLRKKEAEFQKALTQMGFHFEKNLGGQPSVRTEYSLSDYIMPVIFCSCVVLLTMIFLLFGGLLVSMGSGVTNNLLLAGGKFIDAGAEAYIRERQSIAVITIALMGAFVWAAQNIVRRLVTSDLSPGTYYYSGIRMIMAALIALMVSFIFPAEETRDYLMVTAFLIGLFPERGLRYLLDRIKIFSKPSDEQSHPLPLEMIEGISIFHKARFSEVGVDNAQNLAETNLILLMAKTPFNARKLLDWIGQAKLAVYMKEDLFKLTHEGIRTIFDLMVVGAIPGRLEEIAQRAEISELRLKNVYNRTQSDSGLKKLHHFQDRLNILDEHTSQS